MTLIFDFDGTLHQTARIYIPAFRAARAALVAQGYPVRAFADAEITSFLGLNIHDMWRSFLPQAPAEVQAKGAQIIGSALDAALARGNARPLSGHSRGAVRPQAGRPHPGASVQLPPQLRRSGPRALRARPLVFRLLLLRGLPECAQGGDFPRHLPGLSRPLSDDRRPDHGTAGGPDARLRLCGCAYGYGTPEELAGANALCATASQIPQAIERLSSH